MFRKFLAAGLIACAPFLAQAQEADHAIHEELRAVLQTIEASVNSGDYDKMLPVLSEKIRATPINQEFLTSRPDVSAYFKKWFGQGGYLKKLEMHLTADSLTELSPDKTWGIVYGNGVEKYVLSDGRPYEMHTRWTATMAKEDDGHWRVRAIHIATNFLDNPILTQAEHALEKVGAIAGAIGLVLGALLGWFFGRKKKL
jgi:ketosteroid isomerase-like protein